MYLYTYNISIYDNDSHSECGHTGIVFADCYANAIHYIEDVYTSRDEYLTRIELREFDNGLAPCFEMPHFVIQGIIDNDGDYCSDARMEATIIHSKEVKK